MAIILKNDNVDCKFYHDRIKEKCIEINESTKKPFYVEMSVGVHPFVCDPKADLADIFKYSDAVLYEQKSKRRASIKK